MSTATRPSLRADGWHIDAEIEGGNTAYIQHPAPDRFVLAPCEDDVPLPTQLKGVISSYILACQIANETDETRRVTLEVVIPGWMLQNEVKPFDYFLRFPYFWRAPGSLDWHEIERSSQQNLADRVSVSLEFAPREAKIVSTTPAYPCSMAYDRLRQLAAESGGEACVIEIGRSVQGRPILSLRVGDDSLPRVAFTATVQPGEPSAWGILAMAEAALKDKTIRDLYKDRLSLEFLPVTNPDGNYNGNCNTNPAGEILLVAFEGIAGGQAGGSEARVLWEYLAAKRPLVLIDFHVLHMCGDKRPVPMVIDPTVNPDPIRREAGIRLGEALYNMSNAARRYNVIPDHPMWKHLLIYQAMKNWATPSILFQNTGDICTVEQTREIAVRILRIALEAARGMID